MQDYQKKTKKQNQTISAKWASPILISNSMQQANWTPLLLSNFFNKTWSRNYLNWKKYKICFVLHGQWLWNDIWEYKSFNQKKKTERKWKLSILRYSNSSGKAMPLCEWHCWQIRAYLFWGPSPTMKSINLSTAPRFCGSTVRGMGGPGGEPRYILLPHKHEACQQQICLT